jgi:ABC-type multidrug transport system ATPase subunit
MILGILAPDLGTICIDGLDLAAHRSRAPERTNFAAAYSPLPGNVTVAQNLRFFGLIYGIPNLAQRIEALLAQIRSREIPRQAMRRSVFGRAGASQSGEGPLESSKLSLARRAHRVG